MEPCTSPRRSRTARFWAAAGEIDELIGKVVYPIAHIGFLHQDFGDVTLTLEAVRDQCEVDVGIQLPVRPPLSSSLRAG